jgi:hypothetical protein
MHCQQSTIYTTPLIENAAKYPPVCKKKVLQSSFEVGAKLEKLTFGVFSTLRRNTLWGKTNSDLSANFPAIIHGVE